MTPQERLQEFLVDGMKTLGHQPAVFFGQDQRSKQEQYAPGIAYALEGASTIPTDDGDVVLDEVYAVQVNCRGNGAEAIRTALSRRLMERAEQSEEISIVFAEADRDDELDMTYQLLDVRVTPYDSEQPFVRLRKALTFGSPATGITFNGKRLLW